MIIYIELDSVNKNKLIKCFGNRMSKRDIKDQITVNELVNIMFIDSLNEYSEYVDRMTSL